MADWLVWWHGLGLQAGQPLLMEGMDGFADALVAAMHLGTDLLGSLPLAASQKNLAVAQGEGVGRS
jgi:hypothetical protein